MEGGVEGGVEGDGEREKVVEGSRALCRPEVQSIGAGLPSLNGGGENSASYGSRERRRERGVGMGAPGGAGAGRGKESSRSWRWGGTPAVSSHTALHGDGRNGLGG